MNIAKSIVFRKKQGIYIERSVVCCEYKASVVVAVALLD
jgi:hypothetical protein